jgi:hypothetical protein
MLRRVLPAPVKRLLRLSFARFRDLIEKSPQIARVPRDKSLPVSMKVEEVWQRCRTPEDNARYLVCDYSRITGPLNPELLRDCLSYAVRRHEILRSRFAAVDGRRVLQIVDPPETVQLRLIELTSGVKPREAAERIAMEEKAKISGLDRGPLTRFLLLRVNKDEHWLLRTHHHLLWDQWAIRLFHSELALLYEAGKEGKPPPLPAFEPLQYADYSSWQRKVWHRGGRLYRQTIGWWKEAFLGNPNPLELPFKRPVPVSDVDPADGLISLPIDKEVERHLTRLCRSEATTLYVVWLTALAALLARETRETDIVITTTMTGRLRHGAFLGMLGDFSNPVSLRFQCDPTKSFRAFVADIGLQVKQAQEHSEIPDCELRNVLRDLGVAIPEARLAFAMGTATPDLHFADVTLSRMGGIGPTPSNFCISVVKRPAVQVCHANFDPGLYEPIAAQGFVGRLCEFIDTASRNPDSAIGDLL